MNPIDRLRGVRRSFQAAFRAARHDRGRGTAAEQLAKQWIAARGLEVVAQNLVTPAGEVDLVALDGDTLCIIEVKARRTNRYGTALEAVSPSKQRRLVRCGSWLCSMLPWYGTLRFDVVTLDLDNDHRGPDVRAEAQIGPGGGWRLQYFPNAFEAASEERDRER